MAPKMARPAAAVPKAKARGVAKAKAKGKAAAKAGVRGPRVGVLRRPAALVRGPASKKLQDFSLEELSKLKTIWLKQAEYYHRQVNLCGQVQGCRMEDGEPYMDLKATGTQDEELLKILSSERNRKVIVHLCPTTCGGEISQENLVHGKLFDEVDKGAADWMTNLEEVVEMEDENAGLRREAALRDRERGEEESPKEKEKKETGKKKKEKKKEKEKKKDKKGKKKKKSKKSEEEKVSETSSDDLDPGQRPLEDVFRGTGLDPDVKRRKKLLKRAKRVGKSKKKKEKKKGSGSSDSQSKDSQSTSTEEEEEDGTSLFAAERKLKRIWQKYPGCLAATTVMEARNSLVTAAGTSWALEKNALPPVLTQYVRQTVLGSMGAPMAQEVLTVAQALDHLLLGKVGSCADLLGQRLKALESLGKGSHWTIARQHELIRVDSQGLADEAEHREAASRAREDDKLRGMLARSYQGSKPDNSQGKGKKGKDSKGGGKNRTDEGPRGKGGGDGKKDDGRGSWQKK